MRVALLKQLSDTLRLVGGEELGVVEGLRVTSGSSDLQRKDFELQKKLELQSTRGKLEVCQCVEVAEATLGSERTTFENVKERFEDDLDQAPTAKDAVEARVRAVTNQCQWEIRGWIRGREARRDPEISTYT